MYLHSDFIRNQLPAFARQNPSIEISVSPRPGRHPVVIGHYMNGRIKPICVRKLDQLQILNKVSLLKEASGEKLKRVTKPVKSVNESVRGVWSPFHGKEMYKV